MNYQPRSPFGPRDGHMPHDVPSSNLRDLALKELLMMSPHRKTTNTQDNGSSHDVVPGSLINIKIKTGNMSLSTSTSKCSPLHVFVKQSAQHQTDSVTGFHNHNNSNNNNLGECTVGINGPGSGHHSSAVTPGATNIAIHSRERPSQSYYTNNTDTIPRRAPPAPPVSPPDHHADMKVRQTVSGHSCHRNTVRDRVCGPNRSVDNDAATPPTHIGQSPTNKSISSRAPSGYGDGSEQLNSDPLACLRAQLRTCLGDIGRKGDSLDSRSEGSCKKGPTPIPNHSTSGLVEEDMYCPGLKPFSPGAQPVNGYDTSNSAVMRRREGSVNVKVITDNQDASPISIRVNCSSQRDTYPYGAQYSSDSLNIPDLMDRLNQFEEKLSFHQKDHVRQRAVTAHGIDATKSSVEDMEFRQTELKAKIEMDIHHLTERLTSRIKTLSQLRSDAYDSMQRNITSIVGPLVDVGDDHSAVDNESINNNKNDGEENKRHSKGNTPSELVNTNKYNNVATELLDIINQYEAHASAKLTTLQETFYHDLDDIIGEIRRAEHDTLSSGFECLSDIKVSLSQSLNSKQSSLTTGSNTSSQRSGSSWSMATSSSLGNEQDLDSMPELCLPVKNRTGSLRSKIDDEKDRFLRTVEYVRTTLRLLRKERILFENKFIDKIAIWSAESHEDDRVLKSERSASRSRRRNKHDKEQQGNKSVISAHSDSTATSLTSTTGYRPLATNVTPTDNKSQLVAPTQSHSRSTSSDASTRRRSLRF